MNLAYKQKIRRAFDRSAARYEQCAAFQSEIAREVAVRARAFGAVSGAVADLGCGAGALGRELGAPRLLVALDISGAMARRARQNGIPVAVQGDAEALPLRGGSMDMIVTSLALQWVIDLERAVYEAARVLRRGGVLVGAMLGRATFWEMRVALREAMDGPVAPLARGVFHPLPAYDEVEGALGAAGFVQVEAASSRRERRYDSAPAFLRELKDIGARTSPGLGALGLGRRKVMERFFDRYHQRFPFQGGIRATYEVIFFSAVKRP